MKRSFPPFFSRFAVLSTAVLASVTAYAQDPSIDRLLSKLPPPEKIARPPLRQAVLLNDPAGKDPLIRQFGEASSALHVAITIQPKLALAHFGLALVEGVQGRFGAAIPHLQRVIEL